MPVPGMSRYRRLVRPTPNHDMNSSFVFNKFENLKHAGGYVTGRQYSDTWIATHSRRAILLK